MPICYKGVVIDGEGGYRLDRLVENDVLVLVNFNVPVLVKGVKRIMNGCESAALRSKQTNPADSGPA